MLKVGKLDSDLLEKIIIENIKYKRPEVLTRAGVGEDCANIDFGQYECVVSTDPITAAISDIGKLAVYISCNDIASNGIEPLGITLAVLLPEGTTKEEIEQIMQDASAASEECGVEIIGGHTEITAAVNKPVIVSTAIGRGRKRQSASAEDIKVGDCILMTKTAGLEGTGIIASDFYKELSKFLSDDEIKEAASLLNNVSVVKEGILAGAIGTHGMHDVTEGGILGAVWEICGIGGVGAEIWADKVPVENVTRKICDHYSIDYLRLISSGSMLIIASPDKKDEIIKKLSASGVSSCIIGKIVEKSEGLNVITNGIKEAIDPPRPDELYKVVNRDIK